MFQKILDVRKVIIIQKVMGQKFRSPIQITIAILSFDEWKPKYKYSEKFL